MNNFENNSAWGYYPEEMQFDEKTQKFQKVNNNEKIEQNSQKNMQNSAQGFSQNMLSKMFEGNEIISALLKGGALNGASKNNLLMQALSNMTQPKKEKKEAKITVENQDYFEEL